MLVTALAASGLSTNLSTKPAAAAGTREIVTWGSNSESQLGNANSFGSGWASISAGFKHVVGLKNDGTVWAWGGNNAGQLGDGSTVGSVAPVQVVGLDHITAIDAGELHSIALRNDGTVWTWGVNQYGELGDGTRNWSRVPVQVQALANAVAVSAGSYYSLALLADGTVRSWGIGIRGQLGDGVTLTDSLTPRTVVGLTNVVEVSAGRDHALARRGDGTVWAWGWNQSGELGNGVSIAAANRTPNAVVNLTGATSISAGWRISLAARTDGTVRAWGDNQSGTLGVGFGTVVSVPTTVLGATNVLRVSAGGTHSLALRSDHSVLSWGYNDVGQLGSGGSQSYSPYPVTVSAANNVAQVSAGFAFSVARTNVMASGPGNLTLTPGTTGLLMRWMNPPANASVAPGAFDDALPAAPIRHIPIRHIPIRHIPIRHIDLGQAAARIPLARVPLLRDGGWPKYLATTPLAGTPIQRLTVADVLELAPGSSSEPDITLEDLDLRQSALADISLVSVALGEVPIDAIALSDDWQSRNAAQRLAAWCNVIASAGKPCSGVTNTSTIAALDLAGVPIRHIPLGSTPIRHIDFTETPIRHIPIRHIPLAEVAIANSPIRHIPIRHIASRATLFNCQLIDCASQTLTLEDAFAANAVRNTAELGSLIDDLVASGLEYSLADLLALLVDSGSIPWDEVPLDAMPRPVDSNDVDTVGGLASSDVLSGDFSYSAGSFPIAATTITVTLPREWKHDRTDVIVTQGGQVQSFGAGTVSIKRTQLTLTLPSNEAGRWGDGMLHAGDSVHFDVHAWVGPQFSGLVSNLGIDVDVVVDGVGTTTAHQPLDTLRTYSSELNLNSCLCFPQPLPVMAAGGAPYVEWDYLKSVDTPNGPLDHVGIRPIHYYRVAAPPAGQRLVISMTTFGQDADLVAYRAIAPPAGGGTTASPITQVPVEADGGVVGTATTSAEVPGLDGFEPVAASLDRNTDGEDLELVATGNGSEPAEYIIRVAPTAGSVGTSAYRMFARYVAGADPGTCAAYTGRSATAGAVPVIPVGTDAIVLHAPERTQAIYGGTDPLGITALNSALANLVAAGPGLSAATHPFVIDVADLPGVAPAYDAWDATPCDPAAANAVAATIRGAVLDLLDPAQRQQLKSITLVGGDDVLPHARLADTSRVANEATYVGDVTNAGGANNPIAASARNGNFLSDDPYGDFDPVPWLGRYVYAPDVALGRLVETPGDAAAAIEQFIANSGVLDPQTAHVAGYDFLADGSEAVKSALPSTVIKTDQIDTSWTGPQLAANTAGKSIVSLNAHFDHANLLPNASNRPPSVSGGPVLNDQALPIAPKSIVFSMGCHSGLSLPDSYGFSGDQALDWAQQLRQQQAAVFVGNTGFGYGNNKSVALTERLMANFAGYLNGSVTVGEALALAKQDYFRDLGAYGGHDEKALQESTFYGLPMWKVTGSGVVPPVPAPRTLSGPGAGGNSVTVVSASSLSTQTTSDGEYDQVTGAEPQVTESQPIVARESFDVTQPGLDARGVFIEDLTTQDRAANAVIASPAATDGTPVDAEPALHGTAFPTTLGVVNETSALRDTGAGTGRVDLETLVLMRNQFFADTDESTPTDAGTMRRITNVDSRVFYADPNDGDRVAPSFGSVSSVVSGSATDFTVNVGSDAARVLILARVNATDWEPVELTLTGIDTWTGSLPSVSVDEYFAQAVDGSGNVATDANKGIRYSAGAAPTFDAVGPLTGTSLESILLDVPFTDAGSRAWNATVDWGDGVGEEYANVSGNHVVGNHQYLGGGSYTVTVRVCDEGEACATTAVPVTIIDQAPDITTAPTVSGAARTSLSFPISVSDPDSAAWVATINWNDGTAPEVQNIVSSDIVLQHVYNRSGQFVAVVELCDGTNLCTSAETNVTIAPASTAPTLSISDASVLEGDGPGKTSVRFVISRSQADAVNATTVRVSTLAGTAIAGSDYTAVTNKLVKIPARKVSASLAIPVLFDGVAEGAESFTVRLSSPTNATLGDRDGRADIVDDDGTAATLKVGIGTSVITEGHSGARTVQIPVVISRRTTAPISVVVSTTAGTATGVSTATATGGDYVTRTQTLTFSRTAVVKLFTVTLLPDSVYEDDETFSITLSAPPGYQIIGNSTVTIRLVDDD